MAYELRTYFGSQDCSENGTPMHPERFNYFAYDIPEIPDKNVWGLTPAGACKPKQKEKAALTFCETYICYNNDTSMRV